MELQLPLQPGTMAVVHNHRVLHGRESKVMLDHRNCAAAVMAHFP